MKMKKIFAISLAVVMAVSLAGCTKGTKDVDTEDTKVEVAGTQEANTSSEEITNTTLSPETDPWGKYEEPVTVHLGAGVDPSTTFPEGMSKEKNTYLDYIKEAFNVDVAYDWICSSADYNQKVNLCIASNTIPDIMNVNATQYNAMLKYDQLQPIGDAYENCASDMLKSFVGSGGDILMDLISKDGQMMAIPAPNLTASSVNEMWIRQDWLDKLGLEVPTTVDELEAIAKAFVEQDPDGNGKDDTIGILGPSNSSFDFITRIGQNRYGLDAIFAAYGSYPNAWIQDDEGNVQYGSTTPETKIALAKLASLYKEGLIDPEMLVRTDSQEPITAGKAGIFFGPWWCGYTVEGSIYGEGGSDWQSYAAPLDANGNLVAKMAAPTTQYIVVSKNCSNPEVAVKFVNLLLRDEEQWYAEGITDELNPQDAYPLFNVYDNANEIEVSYDSLKKELNGEIGVDDIDYSTHKLLKNDMEMILELKKEPLDDFSIKNWDLENENAKANMGRLLSIMIGAKPVVEDGYQPLYSVYYGETDTMSSKWSMLEKLEKETFAKIIMNQADIDSFDTFVSDWKAQGGDDIIKEITEVTK